MAGPGGGLAQLLASSRSLIINHIDVPKVIPQLVERDIFTSYEIGDILTPLDRRQRAEVFVEILSRKGRSAFEELCFVLEAVQPRLLTTLLIKNAG